MGRRGWEYGFVGPRPDSRPLREERVNFYLAQQKTEYNPTNYVSLEGSRGIQPSPKKYKQRNRKSR